MPPPLAASVLSCCRLQVSAVARLLQDVQNGLDQLAGSVFAQFDRDSGVQPQALVDEIEVQGVFLGYMERVIIGNVGLVDGEPTGHPFAAAVKGDLLGDHRAHVCPHSSV